MLREQSNYTLRNSKVICRVVIVGSYFVISAIFLLVLLGCRKNTYAPGQLLVCAGSFLYIAAAQILTHRNHCRTVAYLLILFYTVLATGIAWTWGINTSFGPLLFGLVIVLAGILLAARDAFVALIGISTILFCIQLTIMLGWHNPNVAWVRQVSNFGDVFAYCVIFTMLALVSWVYNREMESSLQQAKQAEVALLQQKATLKMRVKERTQELRQAQLEEMQQMYRFAELGQLGVTLLHDLANHLTALTLEIEGLQNRQQFKSFARAQEITGHLERLVETTRARLQGGTHVQDFNVIHKIDEAIAFLRHKAARANVTIDWQPPKSTWKYAGDPESLGQVVAIITNNAIDAYRSSPNKAPLKIRRVLVTIQRNEKYIVIRISDWGKGIPRSERDRLFKPHYSAKKSGLGLGLYIAKQTLEMQFSGNLTINPLGDHTEFIIKLPREGGK